MYRTKKINNTWEGRIDPFKIVGNVYFIGTYQASSHLIDTGDGLIVIDSGYMKTLYLVVRAIYELGYHPRDIKYIINTHWHGDHTEGTAALVDLSGAKTLIGHADAERAKRYFEPDILVKDGDTLTCGNTKITFMETPGHTIGTISLFFETEHEGKVYRVGTFGGAGANTLARDAFEFDGCREAYRESLHRLKEEKVDVFLGNHTWNNNTHGLAEILAETGENGFLDDTLWGKFLDHCEARLDRLIAKDEEEK